MSKKLDVELLREGESTTDGRLLLPGSVVWPEIVPLFDDDDIMIGWIYGIERRDDYIYGLIDVDLEQDECISIGSKKFDVADDEEHRGDAYVFSYYQIGYGIKSRIHKYCWD